MYKVNIKNYIDMQMLLKNILVLSWVPSIGTQLAPFIYCSYGGMKLYLYSIPEGTSWNIIVRLVVGLRVGSFFLLKSRIR